MDCHNTLIQLRKFRVLKKLRTQTLFEMVRTVASGRRQAFVPYDVSVNFKRHIAVLLCCFAVFITLFRLFGQKQTPIQQQRQKCPDLKI